MSDQYYLTTSGQAVLVHDGQTPPAGATPLPNSGSSANAAEQSGGSIAAQLQAMAGGGGGVSPGLFDASRALALGGSSGPTIPVWRDRNLKSAPIEENFSANSMEHRISSGNSSANAAEHRISDNIVKLPQQMNQDAAELQFSTMLMDPKLLEQWGQLAINSGLISPEKATDAVALEQAWKVAVGWALNVKQVSGGRVEITPFEAAKMVAQNTGAGALAASQYAQQHFNGTKTTTSLSTNETEPDIGVLHDLLGRNPSAGELAAYRHGVQTVAKANPTKTTTSTTYNDGEAVSQSNVVTGGFDAQQAQQDAAYGATPEVARNQAATTYYNALVNALRSAV